MAASARVFASLPNKQHERLSQLADAKGLSISRLLAGLVERELAENPEGRVQRLIAQAQDDRAPAEKYTVRLMGIDAARLETTGHLEPDDSGADDAEADDSACIHKRSGSGATITRSVCGSVPNKNMCSPASVKPHFA